MDKTSLYYMLAITFTIIVAMMIMVFVCSNSIVISKKVKKQFNTTFALIAIAAIVDLISISLSVFKCQGCVWLAYFTNFMYFVLAPLIPLLLGRIIHSKHFWGPMIVYGAYLIVIIALVSTGYLFTIDENCGYHRVFSGFLFFISIYGLFTLYLLIVTLLLTRGIIAKTPYALYVLFLVLCSASIIQLAFPNVYILLLIEALTTLIFYGYIVAIFGQIDGLTGLYNQFTFIQAIKNIKEGQILFIMDIDDFKSINDNNGHSIGDQVLARVAKIIQQVFGKVGNCYRFGGDEFTAIVSRKCNVEELIEKFNTLVKQEMENNPYFHNVSIGYENYQKGEDITNFENIVDHKMYQNKAINKVKE